ncbi:MAG: nuclear transport factor 2 family protein [Gemmatimonadales bacterium]|nr:nuclear transport factor 2 family protein [Gemmatimonadales bacterium]NIN50125.1 nuclear transport factor 2 family protein [Gemmatimonadales bacterium]NIP07589.1 nuclear transport factor 2 family protein [Gemmatimonadales bacterium]NIR01741.1 nuclear transport factor 2 family protein [Gemmatimonadales bacterium]NIS65644.1 nuclear transport factor 2 family protein [Gemmatimonadales bacterium]
MQMKSLVLLLTLPLAALVFSTSTLWQQADETEAIRQAVQYYIDGHATGDPEIMAKAFHPTARLQYMRNDEVTVRSLESYLGGMRGEPAADEAERERRVVMVDYTGTAAVAKIELDYPGLFITDYMQLLKLDGEWKIVNKIYHVQRK